MTLSLNPTLTQEKQQENKEIQVNNIDIVTQHKPMPTQQENNTESSINTQEPIGQKPNTTQDFDINNKEYQEFVKEFLTTKQTAKDHYDLKYSKDLLKQSIDKFEITQLANPLFIANNIKDMGREGIEFLNKSGDQIKKSETELYDYLAKTGINHEMLGIKNFDEQKLKDAHIRQGLSGKTEYKQLNEEEKDYLKRGQNWAGALWDKMVHSEEKRVEELLRNDTRRYIDPDLLTDLIKIDSAYSSVLNVMKSSETATQDLQKKLKEMDIKAKEKGYAAAVYDKKAKALAIIDKQGKKYYLDEDGVTANLDKIIVNNWNDILLSSIPGAGWGAKGAQLGAKGAGIALKNAGFKGLGKEAAKAGAISFAASPLDYVTLRKEVGGEIDAKQMLEFSAGNALGSAAGVMAIGTLAKGAGKAYNSIKDLKNLSTDDLKNIKISKYLDNEEASIHRKLAKFNKSEIDSNYEIFKGLQSDRVISKEMKDPTFMGNFMDKISDYNVLKHLSSKKESQDKLLSALFSNKELAREFAGKLTSEEATIVNKAIHAMGENFTRLSKEYEQQIIEEYAKSGKIKGLNPHTEMQSRLVEPKHETSSLNGNIFTFSKSQHDKGLNQYDINFNAPTKQVKSQMIEALKPIFNQTMTSSDGVQAYMSLKSLSKMTSPQAIQKSIDNGFSREEHLKAVLDIQRLFENAKLQATEPHKSGEKNAIIHRLNSELENGNALITTKESLDANKNRVYSLELELTPRFSDSRTPLNTKISEGGFNSQKGHQEQTIKAEPSIAKTDTDIMPQNLPEVYKHMLDEIDKQAKQDYKTSIDNLQNALNDTDFKATLLQGYKQVTDDAIESLGLDNQLTNTLIRETQKLESKPNISLAEAIELRKNINEIMRNYEKSSSDLKKFRANKHLDNIKDNIDNAIKAALDSKVAQNEAKLNTNVSNTQALDSVMLSEAKHLNKEVIETFIDSKGNTQEITKEVAQTWMNTFGLKSINDEVVVNVAKEVRQAIGKDIKVNRKDLEKLIENHREQYIPQIKETFETPHVAFIDEKSDLLMGIPLDDKLFFVNVSRDYGKDFLNVTLSPKKNNNLLNKLQNAKQVIIDYPPNFGIPQPNQASTGFLSSTSMGSKYNPTQKSLTRQEADELFSNFQQANKNYAQIKESLNDKFAKALTKGMNKKDLDSRLTIEQWKQRVLDTQWGDSVKGLENTIFKNFNPRMQKHTQMLTILRALDRNVKLNDDSMPIDFTKILSDIENLEKLTLHPEIYPILDTFKSYAKSYQFAQEISKAKALENQVGGGALATTLEGRIKVFLTNRLFKKLFSFIPYIGDNAAITKALQSAIKDLKYPSEITLETLKVLNKADLDKGFKPIKDKEPRFEYKAHTPLSDKELQDQIKGNTQILNPKDTSEIEAIASNPLIQNMERQAKYNEELTQKISQFEANKENIQQDILNNLVVATQEIKQNTELLKQLAQQLTHNNPIHTPNKSIIKAEANNDTYFIINDKNNITAIEKQELQNLAQPKTYDELMQRDKNQNATLESYRDQYVDIAEIKEAQAQKQLLLEYKPEIKETSTSIDNTQIKSIQEIINIIETSPQKGRDMQIIGEANFTPQAVEYAHKNNKKIAIDKLDEAEAQRLGFKHPQDVRVTIDSSAINHTLNRHGVESDLVKQSGQKPVEYSDIANYRNITKTADETLNSVDNMGTPVIVSYKQVNGHFVAVEEIRKKQNELSFKTMFKQEGNYKDSESYKKTSQNSNATEGYEPTANSFALTKKGYKPDLPTPNETIPQTKPYEVNENGRKYIEIPDDELADFEKPIKQALLLEPRQQELLKKINADSKDIDSYAEFMTNERKIMKGHEFTFNQQQEGLADRFLNMANSLENPRDRNRYAENILANMKDDIEKVYKGNASEFLAREAEKPFYKQMDKIRKETDEIVEALNKERDRLHAEKEAQLKGQQEAEKAAEIERIANYDLETAYKEKAHLEKIMQSNRNDYSPYSFANAHNSEFLDKLDLVEQRIRDLKNQLPNKTPQENKPSKVEALKEFIDNARFQVDYAIKAKGTDTALKLIQQMIKDTNNTYEAKFLYRLKNEISSVKEAPKDIHFTDKKGKEHILTKEVQQQWLETFNLKSLDESYTPKHNDEIREALGGKEIKLQLGSLKKLVSQGREQYIPQIKEVLDTPEVILKDSDNAFLFAKHLKDDDYFVNVSVDKGEYLVSISNGIKETNNIKNKLDSGAKVIYQSPNANSNLQTLLQTSRYSANKIDTDIIPQQTLESTMQKFNYDEKKAKDLLEWHKDSSPLTKDENGLPKVFYHGSRAEFDTFETQKYNFNIGHWFSNDEKLAKGYVKEGQGTLFKTFLNTKKPFIMEKELSKEKIAEINHIFNLTEQEQKEALKEVRRFKSAKKELELNGFEFLDFWREIIFLKHKESGKEFEIDHSCLTKKGIAESIDRIKQLKELSEYDKERIKQLQEFDALLPNSLTKMEKFAGDYYKDFFKNETELYLLAAIRMDYWADNPRFNANYGYPTRTKALTPFYKKAGYDGILFNDREIVAFDSNQIKHIDNKGSYTDTKGNITKTKPKNKESTHTYFNENSPNIMYANPSHLGSGIISGSVAGIETDENGNIVGFNPAKFAAGFLGGVVGSKAVAKGLEWRARKVAKSYPNIAKDNPTLMQEIAKKDLQAYAMTNTHNALTRFLNNNKLLDVNPQLFAGEKALVNEAYAPHKARLERAKELESSGADEIEIWEKTGWYKDKDKKWKFEISQSGGELKLKYTPEDKE